MYYNLCMSINLSRLVANSEEKHFFIVPLTWLIQVGQSCKLHKSTIMYQKAFRNLFEVVYCNFFRFLHFRFHKWIVVDHFLLSFPIPSPLSCWRIWPIRPSVPRGPCRQAIRKITLLYFRVVPLYPACYLRILPACNRACWHQGRHHLAR